MASFVSHCCTHKHYVVDDVGFSAADKGAYLPMHVLFSSGSYLYRQMAKGRGDIKKINSHSLFCIDRLFHCLTSILPRRPDMLGKGVERPQGSNMFTALL